MVGSVGVRSLVRERGLSIKGGIHKGGIHKGGKQRKLKMLFYLTSYIKITCKYFNERRSNLLIFKFLCQ